MIDAHDDQLLHLTTNMYWWKPMSAWFKAVQLRAFRDHRVTLSGRVLDLGCGDGGLARLLHDLERLPESAVGIDISTIELRKARRVAPHAAFVQADGGRLPFAGGAFSSVICNEVLSSAPGGPDRILSEIHRVLEPGGTLVVTMPTNAFNAVLLWPRLLQKLSPVLSRYYVRRLMRRLPHLSVYSPAGWQAVLSNHCMDMLDVGPFFGRREAYVWSVLALHAVRVVSVLRVLRSHLAERVMCSIVKKTLARFFRSTPVTLDQAGYLLVTARRRDEARPTPCGLRPLSEAQSV